MIGPYKVIRKLGQGGMGIVLEAKHVEIERHVAIKILQGDLSTDLGIVERFKNEARAVNLIEHPALVQIHDFGQLNDGRLYLVMELLRGVTLSARLKPPGKRMPEAEVLRHAWSLASALCAAHDKHIVHRDIKPINLMLVPDPDVPGGERLKILDFGIAHFGARYRAQDQALTQPGVPVGTPAYMAPEQWRGSSNIDGKVAIADAQHQAKAYFPIAMYLVFAMMTLIVLFLLGLYLSNKNPISWPSTSMRVAQPRAVLAY